MAKKSSKAKPSTTSRSSKSEEDIPLVKPSELSSKITTQPLIEISHEEQLRLIEQSGVLKKIKQSGSKDKVEVVENVEERLSLAEEIFNAILFIIPFSFLLMMMEILIHMQYRQTATLQVILDRLLPGVPILSVFIFYTLRYKGYRNMQILLFIISVVASSRMIYIINKAPWGVNMQQGPPLATIWIYTIVQLDLGPSVLSLLTTGSFVWWKGLNLVL